MGPCTNKPGRTENVKVGGRLGCSNQEMVELKMIWCRGSKAAIRTRTLNFQRANFSLFKDLLSGNSWVRTVDKKGAQKSWSIFKHHFLQAQDQSIPLNQKLNKGSRSLLWLSREFLKNLKQKNKIYVTWKKGQATQEDDRNIVTECQEVTRKAKTHFLLSLKEYQGQQEGLLQVHHQQKEY